MLTSSFPSAALDTRDTVNGEKLGIKSGEFSSARVLRQGGGKFQHPNETQQARTAAGSVKASSIEATPSVVEGSADAGPRALAAVFLNSHHLPLIAEAFRLPERPSLKVPAEDNASTTETPKARESYVGRLLLPFKQLLSEQQGHQSFHLGGDASFPPSTQEPSPSCLRHASDASRRKAWGPLNEESFAATSSKEESDAVCSTLPCYATWLITSFSAACAVHATGWTAPPLSQHHLLHPRDSERPAAGKKLPEDSVMGLVWAALQCCLLAMHQACQGRGGPAIETRQPKRGGSRSEANAPSAKRVRGGDGRSQTVAPLWPSVELMSQEAVHASGREEEPSVRESLDRTAKRSRSGAEGGSGATYRQELHINCDGESVRLWCCAASTCTALLRAAHACKVCFEHGSWNS
jgi:hypothetical protein